MNILHIHSSDIIGGAAQHAYRMKNTLGGSMLVGRQYSKDPAVSQISGIPRFWSPKLRYLQHGIEALSGRPNLLTNTSFNIKNNPKFKNADIVNYHNFHDAYFNLNALPELTKLKPSILSLHDIWTFTGHCGYNFINCEKWKTGCNKCPDLSVYSRLFWDNASTLLFIKKEIFDRCDLTLVANSQWLRNCISNSILKDKEIHVIPLGISQDIFFPMNKDKIRQELNLPLDKTILMFNESKGKEYSFDAQESIKRDDIYFLNMSLLPHIYNEKLMAKYYAASDLLLYPSLADTFSFTVLESMACGTPVITFNTGGIPEAVKHLETGYVAEYKNTQDFINGINLFLNDTELYLRAAINGVRNINQNFTIEKTSSSYKKLYEERIRN